MCKSHIHCVTSIDSIHAPTTVYNTDSLAIGSEGAAQVRVELVVAVCRDKINYFMFEFGMKMIQITLMSVNCQQSATKLNYTRLCKYEAQKAHSFLLF